MTLVIRSYSCVFFFAPCALSVCVTLYLRLLFFFQASLCTSLLHFLCLFLCVMSIVTLAKDCDSYISLSLSYFTTFAMSLSMPLVHCQPLWSWPLIKTVYISFSHILCVCVFAICTLSAPRDLGHRPCVFTIHINHFAPHFSSSLSKTKNDLIFLPRSS